MQWMHGVREVGCGEVRTAPLTLVSPLRLCNSHVLNHSDGVRPSFRFFLESTPLKPDIMVHSAIDNY